jgi:Undecaprenyl-phosphate glucose phosphotransferase
MATELGRSTASLAFEGASRRSRAARSRALFALWAAIADAAAIVVSALAIGWAYHLLALGAEPPSDLWLRIGAIVALLVLIPNVLRNEYQIGIYLDFDGHIRRCFQLWNVAIIAALVLGFLTKTSETFSRGTMILFYAGGLLCLIAVRYIMVRLTQIGAKTGTSPARRIFLVGFEQDVMAFASRHQPWNLGMEIAGVALLPDKDPALASQPLAAAVAQARVAAPDDVFVLLPWERRDLIDTSIQHFLTIPASIHLEGDPLVAQFRNVHIARVGTLASVQLVRRPMSLGEVALKRTFDTIVAGLGLLVLLPLFAVVAVAIKLDSRGPVFFLQRRYGFNQQPFRIWKFRTMLTLDDGNVVRQASSNDPRITRVGRFLRRWNIDELPQLLNVVRGEMSLVGPRPHALAHDHTFEGRIALYARRHNVRPGITGWAQVNGFRGETDTDDKMRARVEHDLTYIDNWSLGLDLLILFRTIFSPKAYRNAG